MARLFDYTDRVALVTGAGQGMGLGIAKTLASLGARVLVNDFYAERAESAASALRANGYEAVAAPGDITLATAAESLCDLARSHYGNIDTLINNAGVPVGMSTSLRTFDKLGSVDFDRQLALNFHAVVHLCRAVLPAMQAATFMVSFATVLLLPPPAPPPPPHATSSKGSRLRKGLRTYRLLLHIMSMLSPTLHKRFNESTGHKLLS